jgi:AcrR family transcriptional regulator
MSECEGRVPGARERAKAERRQRLKRAAITVFLEKGYEGSTTREIAERAGVGAATLFRYAAEKRDLLLMIVNDDLTAINAEAFAKLDIDAPLVDGLLVLFGPRYAYFGANPSLAREATHLTVLARAEGDTFETQRYRHRRDQLLTTMMNLIRYQQGRGFIRADYEAGFLAEFFLDIYIAQRRRWLSDAKPDTIAGLAELRQMLELAIGGVRAQAAMSSTSQSRRKAGI